MREDAFAPCTVLHSILRSKLAAGCADGLLRSGSPRDERNAWRGFSGTRFSSTHEPSPLAMDERSKTHGPQLADPVHGQLQTPANRRNSLCAAPWWWPQDRVVSLLRARWILIASFATRGGSKFKRFLHPMVSVLASLVNTSVHVFTLPGLERRQL